MRNHILGVAFFVVSVWAGPLRFSRDTLCAGTGTGCVSATTLRNTSTDSLVIRMTAELCPVAVVNVIRFPGSINLNTTFDSIQPISNGYLLLPKSSWTSVKIRSGDSLTLQGCTVGSQYLIVARPSHRTIAQRASAARASAPLQLGNGEMIGVVFSTDKGDQDTLHIKVNAWYMGTAIHPRTKVRNPAVPHFSANGRKTAPLSSEIQLGTDGENVNLR